MVMNYSKHIIFGPPEHPLPNYSSFGAYLLQQLKNGGNKIAQISVATGEEIRYSEILQKSINLAVALRKFGIKKGDVVGICSENRTEFSISSIAVMLIGGVSTPINFLYTEDELLHTFSISKPILVFCSPLFINNITSVVNKCSINNIIIFGDKARNSATTLYNDMIQTDVDIDTFKPTDVHLEDPIFILYSSGTTGLPKGISLSHKNVMRCNVHVGHFTSVDCIKDICALLPIPWFHAYGYILHLFFLTFNTKCVYMVKFEEELLLKAIQDHKATVTYLVPTIMIFLAKSPLVDKYDLSSLQVIQCTAAPLSKEIQLAVTERLGLTYIMQAYGLTETTLGVLYNSQQSIPKYGSCGQVTLGTMAKIVDIKTGEALGPNKEGELCFKSDLIMMEYVNDEAATKQTIDEDGWLHTGDIGYYDSDFYFYIVDRLKELIKYKGNQVSPAELEALLLRHPAIKDAGVVGLPDEVAGELPMAFVVISPNAGVTEKEIIDFVASKISPAKRLRGGVRFIQSIPRSPNGKILRKELKKMNTKLISKM